MKIAKSEKVQRPGSFSGEFGSKGIWVEVSHEDLGLPEPRTPEEVRDTFAKLSMECEALILIELARIGTIPPGSISEHLKPWLPQSNSQT